MGIFVKKIQKTLQIIAPMYGKAQNIWDSYEVEKLFQHLILQSVWDKFLLETKGEKGGSFLKNLHSYFPKNLHCYFPFTGFNHHPDIYD